MPIKTAVPTKEQIDELRNLFTDKYEKNPPKEPFHPVDIARIHNDDLWCTRFLEMYDLDMKVSFNTLWDTCIWRQQYGAYDLNESNLVKEYLTDGVVFAHSKDVDGKPLLIFKTKLHVKGAKSMDEVMRVVVYWIERIHRETNMEKMTLFFDMAGTSVGNMDLEFVKRIIDTFKLYYPNALNYILIFEMAWVLNAAFKIIKGFLPAKALEILKMIGKKDINTYVDKNNCLTSWGGNDNYEFKFVPEQLQQKPTAPAAKADKTASVTGATDLLNGHDKKVHFANSRPYAESEMPECERGYSVKDAKDTMLQISPVDNLYFNRGENSEITLELTSTCPYPVTFKIQTTAPEKFRVRPRCGYVSPSETVPVSIVLKQDYVLGEVSKDKFLVMCMPAPNSGGATVQQMCDLWKQKPTNSPDVEQHRLTCAYRGAESNAGGSGAAGVMGGSYGSGASGGVPSGTVSGAASYNEQKFQTAAGTASYPLSMPKSTNTVAELSSQAKLLGSQLKFTQILQCISLFFLLVLSVAVAYMLKIQLSSPKSPCEAINVACGTCAKGAGGHAGSQ